LFPPSIGFALAGFFFPLALSLCSFCFSFANVLSPLAAFLTSLSFKLSHTCFVKPSMKEGKSGFEECRERRRE
jgi:hypothetical protein